MSQTGTLNLSYSGVGGNASCPVSKSNSSAIVVDESIVTGQTVFQINVAIDVSAVTLFWMSSDQNIKVKVNDSGSPTPEIDLVANVPYLWFLGYYTAFILTVDVTKVYIENTSGTTANLTIRGVQDSSP